MRFFFDFNSYGPPPQDLANDHCMSPNDSHDRQTDKKTTHRNVSTSRKVLYSLITSSAIFIAFEFLLRLIGFQVTLNTEKMVFTFPLDDYNKNAPEPFLTRDDTVFWRPKAGVMDHNTKGFYGPEFSIEKKPGVTRIVCLGDSCTHFGPETYPDILRVYLDEVAPGQFEVINAGVIGYTSFQGRKLLESEVLDWSPDIVTVYFGWNDHWLARGREDKNQNINDSYTQDTLQSLRTYQLASYFFGGNDGERPNKKRVEPQDYITNLRSIQKACRSINAKVWYFTAPHALDLGIPPYLVESGEIADEASLIPLHRQYNQTVRSLATDLSSPLIDLESEMDGMNKAELFLDDHIHLTMKGRFYAARRMIDTLVAEGLLAESLNIQ